MKSNQTLKSGLHALVWQEERWFISRCLEVEVSSQGKSKKEALKNLDEALELYFEDEKVHQPKSLSEVELFTLPPKVCYA